MIVGTAGHVDHGKTALVRALTGVDTDRLKVEKERGITTELGFAPLSLAGGAVVSVVDVPGHERFVSSMAAGAGGVDLALLVVALDEGVMPQTREHLDICALLGVRAGILVLTKADVITPSPEARSGEVEAELRDLARGTVFATAPAVSVSARTGQGIDELRHQIERSLASLQPRPTDGLLYMGIDRAFTLKGFGTVVTGTILSGSLDRDEDVVILPSSLGALRVRGLQTQNHAVAQVRAGERAALNLVGLEVGEVSRGMIVGRPAQLIPSARVDVELRCLPALPTPLGPRDAFVCHVGAASSACRLSLLGAKRLPPGETAYGQLILERPLPLLAGQRFLLRGFQSLEGHGRTVAGGQVLQIEAPRRRPSAPHRLADLGFANLPLRISVLVEELGGATQSDLMGRAGVGRAALEAALGGLRETGVVRQEGGRWVKVTAAPQATGDSPPQVAQPPALEPLDEAILSQLRRGNLAPPTVSELALRLRSDQVGIVRGLERLAARKLAVRAAEGMFFEAGCLQSLRERLTHHLRENQSISVADFKTLTGVSRRFVIPLSELFDKERLTLRVGDRRVLREHNR